MALIVALPDQLRVAVRTVSASIDRTNKGAAMIQCRRCGGELVRKPMGRLVAVGVAMLVGAGLGVVWPGLWPVAVILVLTGVYLLAWAAVGKGRWCRGCKRFDGV
jgi:hypothetical protein